MDLLVLQVLLEHKELWVLLGLLDLLEHKGLLDRLVLQVLLEHKELWVLPETLGLLDLLEHKGLLDLPVLLEHKE
jgi:hypothetical protein